MDYENITLLERRPEGCLITSEFQKANGREPTMVGHDPVVMQAIRNVTDRHSMDHWSALSASQRTKAIYDEIKRLDADTLRASGGATVAAVFALA